MKNYHLNRNGFTLIEMAIVLVIVGLLIGMGVGMIGPLTNRAKMNETRESLSANVEAITSWAASNNRIPPLLDPAPPPLPQPPVQFNTIIPKSIDSWSNPLIYIYDINLSPLIAKVTKDTICGRRSTEITITDNRVAPAATINNVAFVVLSKGADTITQTTLNGALITASGAAIGTITIDTNASVPPPPPIIFNDDIIRWVTLDELRSKVGCQGSQLKIVNNELPPGNNLTPYTASIYAEGGVPYLASGKYSWCIQNTTGTVPPNITYKNTGGANIPFSTDCKGGVIESGWTRSDSIIVATTPTVVIGDDSKYYTCILSHTATAINRPISGTSWSTYWIQAGNSGLPWISGTSYTAPPSTNYFTVFVRDTNDTSTPPPLPATDNDNFASKSFVLTVSPQ